MRRCLEQAEADRSWGIREEAGRLFQEANYHKREMESLNAEAAEWIYKENNRPGFSSPGEINLHSLTVQEAVMFTERAIREAQQHGESEIRLVLGRKGHRSHHQRAKLKRTLEDLTRKYNAEAEHGQYHDNVLVVRLGC
ncbi:hypothetical protein OBBRIDRAFT_243509 [Obba rivulosa]|uniref:Smr domain-containing protein n=1 Tax=Obba rivulosa TaxID=1052685 RepID=A0A8E2AKQ0_9APHY|nr:hypothetical protein OBBRIDRAFT_243509 [Obba rivulosa]